MSKFFETPPVYSFRTQSEVGIKYVSLRKHPFVLALRRWGRENVPSGEERGQRDVFAGYNYVNNCVECNVLTEYCWLEHACPSTR